MIPDRDYMLAKAEVERRRRLSAEERAAREARRAAAADPYGQAPSEQSGRPFGWLRRLAGARN